MKKDARRKSTREKIQEKPGETGSRGRRRQAKRMRREREMAMDATGEKVWSTASVDDRYF